MVPFHLKLLPVLYMNYKEKENDYQRNMCFFSADLLEQIHRDCLTIIFYVFQENKTPSFALT